MFKVVGRRCPECGSSKVVTAPVYEKLAEGYGYQPLEEVVCAQCGLVLGMYERDYTASPPRELHE